MTAEPSLVNATLRTVPLPPVNTFGSALLSTSQIRSLASSPPHTMRRPSALNAAASSAAGPLRVRITSARTGSHRRSNLSSPAERISRPSGENATLLIAPESTLSVLASAPLDRFQRRIVESGAAGDERLPVWREGETLYRGGVPAERVQFSAVAEIPDLNRLIS